MTDHQRPSPRVRRNRRIALLTGGITTILVVSSCSIASNSQDPVPVVEPERMTVEIVDTHPFDPDSFTQGLEFHDGEVIVGTGLNGESEVYRRDLETVQRSVTEELPDQYFGEGITVHGDNLWQLTWTSGMVFKRDASTLEETGQFALDGEGWGICSDQDSLYVSDGTDEITVHDPVTFTETGAITVVIEGEPLENINELECVGGEIYANVWGSTDIVRIDPLTGAVTAVVDASSLENTAVDDPDNVLNGIAYYPEADHFLLTGKRWEDLYEVRFVPVES